MTDTEMLAQFWIMLARSVQADASLACQRCSQTATEMITSKASKFVAQPTPTTHDDLSFRNRQAMALTGERGAICDADRFASRYPNVRNLIFAATREACGERLPGTSEEIDQLDERLMRLVGAIGNICDEHRM
jgi:hypothetical protein